MVPPRFRNWLIDQDHESLEKAIQELSEREGWDSTRTKITGDGGYDLVLDSLDSGKIIEVVNRDRVGPGEIREIAGAAYEQKISETAVAAISFTDGALETADEIERNSEITIELWDEEYLYNKIVSLSIQEFINDFSTNENSSS